MANWTDAFYESRLSTDDKKRSSVAELSGYFLDLPNNLLGISGLTWIVIQIDLKVFWLASSLVG